MKTKLLPIAWCTLLICFAMNSNAQANRKLSNLTSPTAVNQSLLPGTDNAINLGGPRSRWSNLYIGNNLYLGNALYLKGNIAMHAAGTANFFAGNNAGNTSLTGGFNTGTGQFSLFSLTSGSFNTANGYEALYHNTTGGGNTANGSQALFNSTTGGGNTGNGTQALSSNTTGSYNTASGYQALINNTTASYNTANGYETLYKNTSGFENTANGYEALYNNTEGTLNTANGNSTLYSNTTGFFNTANGGEALYHNTTGYSNTANGKDALRNNTIGNGNTAIGSSALYYNTTGYGNTALGEATNVSTGNLSNATAIGYGAIVDASSKVRIGDHIVTSIGGQVDWSIFSDGRYKKDIKEDVQGLAFINSLRPITYTVNIQGLDEYYNKGRKPVSTSEDGAVNAEMKKAEDEAGKIVHSGFIAQEVEAAAKKLNYEFSGVDKPQSKDGVYGLRYGSFVVPLVKAVQELSKMNDSLNLKIKEFENLKIENEKQQKINEDVQKRIGTLEAIINAQQSTINHKPQPTNSSDASLAQNTPNPFINATTINYKLPQKFTTAQIAIIDKNGKQLKQLNISGSGKGSLNIDASTLTAGTYNYSLIVDGKLITSKQMILVK